MGENEGSEELPSGSHGAPGKGQGNSQETPGYLALVGAVNIVVFGLFKPRKKAEPAKPKKKIGRPTKEEAAERRLIQLRDAEARVKLAKLNRELEKLEGGGDDSPTITDKTVVATVKYLKNLGLEVRPIGGGRAIDDDGLGSILKSVAVDVGKGFAEVLVTKQQQAQAAQAEPTPQPAPQQIAAPQPQPQPPPPPAPEEAGMSIESMYLVGVFDQSSPEQFAKWLLARPEAGDLIRLLQATTDDQIPAKLAEVPQRVPKLAGFVGHLRKHPQKFMAVVKLLRQMTGSAETSPPEGEDVGL